MTFPRYPKYKDSGAEWLGKVPDHWNLCQSRRLFSQERESARAGDDQLSATQKYGVVPQKLFMEMEDQKVALALSGVGNFKHVEKDDFVISLRSFEGGIERSVYSGCVSPAYTVLRPIEAVEGRFWGYLLKSKGFVESLQSVTDGIRDGKSISYQQFGQILVPYVPMVEQDAIANFLDRETARIDALVAEQRRLMELLKEKRQAVISHAVTKGLNPHTPVKNSGIEWLGEVPMHWRVLALRLVATVVRGASPRPAGDPRFFNGDAVPWVTVAEITKDTAIYLTETESLLTKEGSVHSNLFQRGTLIYSNSGATLGVPKILCLDACANDGVVAFLNLDRDVLSEFLYHCLASITEHIRDKAKQGSGQPNLNTDIVKDLRFGFPPPSEQREIVERIAGTAERFDALTVEAQRAIDLLLERRTALISAAVTGQIDVREIENQRSAA